MSALLDTARIVAAAAAAGPERAESRDDTWGGGARHCVCVLTLYDDTRVCVCMRARVDRRVYIRIGGVCACVCWHPITVIIINGNDGY